MATWAASVHGPYPSGNPSAQPDLKFAFPVPAEGAVDQSFRLIVKPDLWGDRFRIRLANTFGTQPVDLRCRLYRRCSRAPATSSKARTAPCSSTDRPRVMIAPGASAYSDAIELKLPAGALTEGRKLAISFHVAGPTGPMTWHAKALQTSYLSGHRSGVHSAATKRRGVSVHDHVLVFPRCRGCHGAGRYRGRLRVRRFDHRRHAVDAERRRPLARCAVAPASRGVRQSRVGRERRHRREPHSDARHAIHPRSRSPAGRPRCSGSIATSFGLVGRLGGRAAGRHQRHQRGRVTPTPSSRGCASWSRASKRRGIKIVGATITPSLTANGNSGTADANQRRQAVNSFIRTGGLFDAVADFDAATVDPNTGALREEFVPNSTVGGAGDRLHPNRAGYQAMGSAIDLRIFAPGR